MAFPVVEATAETAVSTAGTSHAITLPSGIVSTDMVVIVMSIGLTAATMNALTDWTELLDQNVAAGLKAWVYTGAGVPSNPTFTSSASTRSASVAYRISGANKAVNPTLNGTTATGTSTTPDPPASAALPGGVAKDCLVIAFCGSGGEQADDDTYVTTFPTNYSHSQNEKACGVAGTNQGGLIGAASRQINIAGGGTENPGTFTVSENAAWNAQTMLIEPDPTQSVGPNAIASAEAFGSPTVTVGPVDAVANAIASAEAWGSPTVEQPGGAQSVEATGIASAEAFGSPTVQPGEVSVVANAIASAEAFGSPTVTPGPVSVSVNAIASAEAFGLPDVQPGAVSVAANAIASAEAFGQPSVTTGALTVTANAIASEEAFGSPTVTPGAVNVVANAIASAEAFGSPTVSVSDLSVVANAIASAEAFGQPTVTGGTTDRIRRLPWFSTVTVNDKASAAATNDKASAAETTDRATSADTVDKVSSAETSDKTSSATTPDRTTGVE